MRLDVNLSDLESRYARGESVLHIAKSLGISRGAVIHRLSVLGLPVRSRSQANLIRLAKLSKEERLQLTDAAHSSVRGKPQSAEHRSKIAETYFKTPGRRRSELEGIMQGWLEDLGMVVTPQYAVGPYNIDLAICPSRVAVEIFGGNWHATGHHAARYRERVDYLLDRGWLVFIIWAHKRGGKRLFDRAAAEHIVATIEAASRNESLRRQEHVIRGDAKRATVCKYNPDNGAVIMGARDGNKRRGSDGRFC